MGRLVHTTKRKAIASRRAEAPDAAFARHRVGIGRSIAMKVVVFVNVRQQLAMISSFSMSPALQDSDPPPFSSPLFSHPPLHLRTYANAQISTGPAYQSASKSQKCDPSGSGIAFRSMICVEHAQMFSDQHTKAKAAALRINLNIDGCSKVAPPMHAPSQNLPFPAFTSACCAD